MKKLIMAACAILLIPSAFAADDEETFSYKAKAKPGSDVFCAKVEVQTLGAGTVTRTRCRTIKQWEKAGYSVTMPDLRVEDVEEDVREPV